MSDVRTILYINRIVIRENASLNFFKEHSELMLSIIAVQQHFNFIKTVKTHKMHGNKTITFVF